jgi:hypothetical protein
LGCFTLLSRQATIMVNENLADQRGGNYCALSLFCLSHFKHLSI